MREIIIIAAMAENWVIGKDGFMPWSIKGNLAHFKEMTMGWPCIMGRKTWESIPRKPLPGRLNIVISKAMTGEPKNNFSSDSARLSVIYCGSLLSALECCPGYEKIFICGGESIYTQALPLADKIDLTLIPGQYDGDAFFPELDDACWTKTNTVDHDDFSVITYNKTNNKEQL